LISEIKSKGSHERKKNSASQAPSTGYAFPFLLGLSFTSFARGGIHKPGGAWNPLQALLTHDKPGRTKLDLVVDYVHETSQTEGFRIQHSLDAGFIYEIAKGHKVGVNGRVGLDGDGVNGDWGSGVFYTIAMDGLPSLAR